MGNLQTRWVSLPVKTAWTLVQVPSRALIPYQELDVLHETKVPGVHPEILHHLGIVHVVGKMVGNGVVAEGGHLLGGVAGKGFVYASSSRVRCLLQEANQPWPPGFRHTAGNVWGHQPVGLGLPLGYWVCTVQLNRMEGLESAHEGRCVESCSWGWTLGGSLITSQQDTVRADRRPQRAGEGGEVGKARAKNEEKQIMYFASMTMSLRGPLLFIT